MFKKLFGGGGPGGGGPGGSKPPPSVTTKKSAETTVDAIQKLGEVSGGRQGRRDSPQITAARRRWRRADRLPRASAD